MEYRKPTLVHAPTEKMIQTCKCAHMLIEGMLIAFY